MTEQPKTSSTTMRIDIPPDMRDELLRLGGDRPKAKVRVEAARPPPARAETRVGGADFQQLFQSVYDGAIIAETNGEIVDSNSRAQEFLKRTRNELRAASITDIISGADTSTVSTLNASLEVDRFVLIQAYCSRKDESIFPAEIAVNRLLVDNRHYLCIFIRDVTRRREAEEMLRTVHNAIQNTSAGIAITNRHGQIEYVNNATARFWGQDRREALIGKHLKDLFPEGTQAEDMVQTVMAGSSWTGEISLLSSEGAAVHIQVVAAANRDAEDQLAGMVMSLLDISDRMRAEQAERQSERQRVMVESLGAACHHLGQPATILLASLELMARMQNQDRAVTEELLSSSMDAAESLRKMLHELNDMTEAEYRTRAYMEGGATPGAYGPRILDIHAGREP
jgi:PAS domain S-box-containing protein